MGEMPRLNLWNLLKSYWRAATALWEFFGYDTDALAQWAHVGWGGFIPLALALFISTDAAIFWSVAFAIVKEASEFVTETKETRGSFLDDILFWLLGIAISMVMLRNLR